MKEDKSHNPGGVPEPFVPGGDAGEGARGGNVKASGVPAKSPPKDLARLVPLVAGINEEIEKELSGDGKTRATKGRAGDSGLLREVGLYNFRGGGKRLRPIIYLLSYASLGKKLDAKQFRRAIVFELIHMASLLHDDIVDDSDTRRGRKAAHAVYGMREAILAGDYLLARAATAAMETENLDFVRILVGIIEDLATGELLQLKAKGDATLTAEDYLVTIELKTATLLRAAASAGALFGEADEKQKKDIDSFALNFGLAFQVVDDVLDYEADPDVLGKPVLKDLSEGRITLPLILALRDLDPGDRDRLTRAIADVRETLAPGKKEEILSLVGKAEGTKKSLAFAKDFADKAKEALSDLPDTDAKRDLMTLCDYVVKRDS
ncbi:MAG: polyprenyl synthetase family protein [Deltaproteobacteria bacterium]|nr:polyprenyl synthetase family protein [Deltaproteobacteria bacterium]